MKSIFRSRYKVKSGRPIKTSNTLSTIRTHPIERQKSSRITSNQADYPIKYIRTPPGGVARALNDATEYASGDILHYLHSDVFYYNDLALEKAADHFSLNPNLIWLTGKLVVLSKGKMVALPNAELLRLSSEKALSFTNFVSHENTFIRRNAVLASGGFNEDKNYNVEYSVWLNLIQQHKPLIVDTPFTVFIIHKGSTSTGSVLKLSQAFLRGFNTLRKERVFPLIGCYGDHFIYNQYERIAGTGRR